MSLINNVINKHSDSLTLTNALTVANGGTGAQTLTVHGILLGEATAAISATTAGSAGQIITSSGALADPTWTTATYPATIAKGLIVAASNTNVIGTVASTGSAGQFLVSGGAATLPTWTTATYPSTVAKGDIVTATDTNILGVTADVATGQALMSGGVGAVPAYSGSPSFSTSVTAPTAYATTFDTNVAAAKLQMAGTTITATGSDTNVGVTVTPKGTGKLTLTTGNVDLQSGNLSLNATSATIGQILQAGNPIFQTYGTGNTFVGLVSGNLTLTTANAYGNTGVGSYSLNSLVGTGASDSQFNSCVGYSCLNKLTLGSYNVSIGEASGDAITTGSHGTYLGSLAGHAYTSSESSNICIGYNTVGTTGESNKLRIGVATGTGNGELNAAYICGVRGTSLTGGALVVTAGDQIGVLTSTQNSKTAIVDMGDDSSVIYNLRPRTFKYINTNIPEQKHFGLVAEEVEPIFPEMVIYDVKGQPWTLAYHFLAPMLVNEIQKLEIRVNIAEDLITELQTQIVPLQTQIEILQAQKETLQTKVEILQTQVEILPQLEARIAVLEALPPI